MILHNEGRAREASALRDRFKYYGAEITGVEIEDRQGHVYMAKKCELREKKCNLNNDRI